MNKIKLLKSKYSSQIISSSVRNSEVNVGQTMVQKVCHDMLNNDRPFTNVHFPVCRDRSSSDFVHCISDRD